MCPTVPESILRTRAMSHVRAQVSPFPLSMSHVQGRATPFAVAVIRYHHAEFLVSSLTERITL
eukprot:3255939-Rhodomonas_salina.4